MKFFPLILISICSVFTSYAQSIHEFVRYGTETLNGTARYQAMAGAFGALGGDLSSLANNPAGSTVFAYNEAGATIGIQSFSTTANYFGNAANVEKSSFDISQAGFVLVLANPSSKWDKIAFGFNTQTSNNFDKNLYAQGINSNNGLEDYFLNNASDIPFDTFNLNSSDADGQYARLGNRLGYRAQQAYLGLYAGAIIYDDMDDVYVADGLVDGGINQRHELNTSGEQQVYTLNFSGRYMKKLSLGVNINIYSVDYSEYKATSDLYIDELSSLKEVDFRQEIHTFGTGVSFQFGAMFKATDILRLGLNYTSPTYYELEDEYTDGLQVFYRQDGETKRGAIYPNIINIVDPYRLRTAGKTQGSMALVFGKKGLLSLDYGTKNYASSRASLLNTSDTNLLNNEISNSLDKASFLRVGGEGRLGDFSLRGGYWSEQSPYKNAKIKDAYSGFSLGMGIRFGNGSLDVAYTKNTQNYTQQLYYTGLTDTAAINQKASQVTLSYNVRF